VEGTVSVEQARAALASGAWPDAYAAFRAVDPSELTAYDLDGMADAAWWVSQVAESIEVRHKAYSAHLTNGDERGAAAAAARLAIDHFIREEPSIGAGFLMRARRHADAVPEGPERGFVDMLEGTIARFSGDLERAVELSDRAIDVGRRLAVADLTAMAIHSKGLCLVSAGRVNEGVALLDEAMAAVLAGDVSPYFMGIIYCSVIATCLELGDIGRAGEWSDAARLWSETLPPGSPLPGMCRINQAEVSRMRGSWSDAENEARRAVDELMGIDPALAAAAFSQLGEVRRRIGDLVGAEAAFERAQELGDDPQPGFALVRLAQGKPDAARSALRLAFSGAQGAPRRARLLAAQVEVAISAGELDEARTAADELGVMGSAMNVPAFVAAAATASGSIALAVGDVDTACEALRRATLAWRDLRLPYETATARKLLGRALLTGGDGEGARRELRGAIAEFDRLGAVPDATATRALLESPTELPGGLTAREAEVLRLVASGKTNRDIAVELVISEHTVARHLQNMFTKLGVSSRAGATAFAFEHGLAPVRARARGEY
jgi:ATP/maltotriose-dependent transcriptional regulator MalT